MSGLTSGEAPWSDSPMTSCIFANCERQGRVPTRFYRPCGCLDPRGNYEALICPGHAEVMGPEGPSPGPSACGVCGQVNHVQHRIEGIST